MKFLLPLLLLWVAWIVQAWLSAWQVRKFAGRFAHPSRSGLALKRPRAVVIVPFKGLDQDLLSAVASLCNQDYPDYHLIFVVDSAADSVYPVLQREVARHPHRQVEILVAGVAGLNEGQKVHNQLFAIDKLLAQGEGPEAPAVWVFADSDAVPGPLWLNDLIAPLLAVTGDVGLTTGYRWLVPVEPGASLASRLGSVINSSVACFFGRDRYNHAWGGSMAVLAETARKGDLRGRLTGALCDDYQFSRMVRDLGLKIYFVRHCLVTSPTKMDWPALMNFSHRQYLLTRVYAPGLFIGALAIQSLYAAGAVSAWLTLAIGLAMKSHAWPVIVAGVAVVAVAVANQFRATFRKRVVAAAFGPVVLRQLGPSLRLDRWATTLWMLIHWRLTVRACFGKTMSWRGIYYRLYAPQRVRRLNRG